MPMGILFYVQTTRRRKPEQHNIETQSAPVCGSVRHDIPNVPTLKREMSAMDIGAILPDRLRKRQ